MRDPSSAKSEIPRSVALNKESITAIDINVVGDASIVVSSAVVQLSVTNQKFFVSKSRISKKNFIISRLELVSAQHTWPQI